MVQQLTGSTPTANYLTGGLDQTFQVSNSAGTSSLLTDQLGSTIALANGAGKITTSYTYDPFGAVTTTGAANSNPIQYAGTYNDGTGLYSMGARYYSPSQSQFVSQDPIGFNGGQTDLYEYVGDDHQQMGPTPWGRIQHHRTPLSSKKCFPEFPKLPCGQKPAPPQTIVKPVIPKKAPPDPCDGHWGETPGCPQGGPPPHTGSTPVGGGVYQDPINHQYYKP